MPLPTGASPAVRLDASAIAEQGHVTRRAKRNYRLTQERIGGHRLAAAEGRLLKQGNACADCLKGTFGQRPVVVASPQKEVLQPFQISLRRFREADLERHADFFSVEDGSWTASTVPLLGCTPGSSINGFRKT